MASSLQILVFSSILTIFISFSKAQTSFIPRALVLPVSKDSSLQYLTHFKQRTPLVSLKLVLDLGGQILWVDCENNYISSTYRHVSCGARECDLAGSASCATEYYSPARPGRNNNTCGVFPDNTVKSSSDATGGELAKDVVSLQSTTGKNPGPVVSVPSFVFACGTTAQLEGLAKGAKGMAGLGRTRYALPLQFAANFNFYLMKFAICLPSTTKSQGVAFFGDGPYFMQPNIDVSSSLTYTPLYINKVSTASIYPQGQRSSEYFIGIKSIKINDQAIPLNTTLLAIKKGNGGTKISTVNPYTVMETSIYKSVTGAFVTAAKSMKLTAVASVPPFKFCFSSKNVASTRVGPDVPTIDLVLQSKSVYWRIFGANSMVQVMKEVMCLGFLDGGSAPRTSIVIGGYQLEDNLLQFDLKKGMLGFSSSLLFRQTTCSNFNFTSNV